MVHIETIDLATLGVTLPSDRVGMVIAQPYLSLTSVEPYQCTPRSKPVQLAMLTDTLAVARASQHGAPKTHFTIFPEYSIPGLDGIALIEAALRAADWPSGTIVIGGTDALPKQDFVTLASASGTHVNASDNVLGRIGQTQWVNCCITWVKSSDGKVERWLQPKLFPAWPEQDVSCQDMFRGNSLFTFRGPFENGTQYYRFCSLVCFDWIATVDNKKIWRWVMEDLQQQAAQAQAEFSLSWFFVIQCNRKPSDDSFLIEAAGFFDQTTIPSVRRERACLVFANSAGKAEPGRNNLYGSTSLVFSGQTLFEEPKCHSTFCNGGSRFRSSTLLSAHRDVLFREGGACIHSFLQINPNSLSAGAAGKTIALQNAFVFPLNRISDPRVPREAVPACVKWLNDELDDLPSLSSDYATALTAEVDAAHQRTIAGLRVLAPHAINHSIKLATQLKQAEHADEWDHAESEALEHLTDTLDIVGIGFVPSVFGSDGAHAAIQINGQTVDLLAVLGASHEDCIEHSKKLYSILPRRQALLVSRDRDNNPCRRRFGSFLDTGNPLLGQERKITDPASGTLHLGYRRVLDIFQQSRTVAEVQGAIIGELTT